MAETVTGDQNTMTLRTTTPRRVDPLVPPLIQLASRLGHAPTNAAALTPPERTGPSALSPSV